MRVGHASQPASHRHVLAWAVSGTTQPRARQWHTTPCNPPCAVSGGTQPRARQWHITGILLAYYPTQPNLKGERLRVGPGSRSRFMTRQRAATVSQIVLSNSSEHQHTSTQTSTVWPGIPARARTVRTETRRGEQLGLHYTTCLYACQAGTPTLPANLHTCARVVVQGSMPRTKCCAQCMPFYPRRSTCHMLAHAFR